MGEPGGTETRAIHLVLYKCKPLQLLQKNTSQTNWYKMDIKKFNIPTLDGPNWGQYIIQLQAAAHILDCYNVLRGEILTPPPN